MNEQFKKDFFDNRDYILNKVKENSYDWGQFLRYWSKMVENYSIDNILNLYSYNPYGKVFMTFDEWNSDEIGRRIKRQSKGIPIILDGRKIYVFDIKQTYGKDYSTWNYSHFDDTVLFNYYQSEHGIQNNDTISLNENYFETFNQIATNTIKNNYVDIKEQEVEFIAKTMASLFLMKSNFIIHNLPDLFAVLESIENEEILKCMQIINKETTILYQDFVKNATFLDMVQQEIQGTVLKQYKNDNFMFISDKEKYLEKIGNENNLKYEMLDSIYNHYIDKYKNYFPKSSYTKKENEKHTFLSEIESNSDNQILEDVYDASHNILGVENEKLLINNEEVSEEEFSKFFSEMEEEYFDNVNGLNDNDGEINNQEIVREQLSLFFTREEELANKICGIFNSFDTKYKNTFEVHNVELQRWEQKSSKKRNLSITLGSPLADFGENAFTHFNSDKTDEKKMNDSIATNAFLYSLYQDKDFSINLSPQLVHIYWDKFDEKQFDLSIPNTKLIESELDSNIKNFNCFEFEKRIPHNMRWKEYSIIRDCELYWVTQEFFDMEDLKKFQKEFSKTEFTYAYVTVRDFSSYDYEEDFSHKIFAKITKEDIYADDYLSKMKLYLEKSNIKKMDGDISYRVTTTEMIPTYDGVETNVLKQPSYNKDGKELEKLEEVKEEILPINYHISDDRVDNSFKSKSRFEDNVVAIELLKELELDNRNATQEEQDILSKYVGWGGLADVFDERKENWLNEREKLRKILTEDEYKSAIHSTLSSFYTPNMAIDIIYKALERFGFQKGHILEPACGIGNFFGRIPNKFAHSKLYGVEMDSISGRIAKKLYPSAKIEITGYEQSNVIDNSFDIAIGNVPFGNNSVFDKRYKNKFLIHDYFFQKTLDKVRNGGIIAFITTDGTLDKKDTKVREYIAKRAEFLGAIRLPNNTFTGNANTKVTSDIIFLKKREELKLDISDEHWIYTDEYDDGIIINNYYIDNPNMMLGKMELQSSMYGMDKTLNSINEDMNILIDRSISNLPNQIYQQVSYEKSDDNYEYEVLDIDDKTKNNSFVVVNKDNRDIIYQRQDSSLIPYPIQTGMVAKRIIGLCKIKNALREVFDIQLRDGTDEELLFAQERLNREYDAFVKKYGYINDSANARVFEEDSDYYLLTSVENKISENDENDKTIYEKGDVFTKRTIRKAKDIVSVQNAEEALRYSLNKRGCVDLEYMKTLYPKGEEIIIEELGDLIYQDPVKISDFNHGWVLASEYLSGNVKQKLNYVNSINENNKYDKNVQALEKVQPTLLEYDEISFKLGSTWIPEDIYHRFCVELLDIPSYHQSLLKITFAKEVNTWLFQASGLYGYGEKNTSIWGTNRVDALSIIKNTLNLQNITVYDILEDGSKAVNSFETARARQKQEAIKLEFKNWLWNEEERRDRLVKIYNERFNCMRERTYDGSHLTFDGMNPNIELRSHQKNAVARILYGGNTLLAHSVGAGKTYECIAGAMELKRLGLINKPMFAVPNNLLGQWASDLLKLYPMANILVATQKDFESKRRKKLMARIATGEWDAVLIAHSSFGLIPMSREYEKKHIESQIKEITNAVERIKIESNETISVKKLEQMKSNMEIKLKILLDSPKDDVVTFEELGVDELIIDEAHMFKNLPLFSKMRNVAGVGNCESKKATDLFMKISYILENNNRKGAIFATGTPISNSMGELFVMQKYLQPDKLKELGLEHFDDWASTFGEIVNSFELAPDGSGFRTKSRFSQFFNIPELMVLFKEIADVQTSKMLKLPIPKLKDGNYKIVVAPKSDELGEYLETLSNRSEMIKNGCDPRVDNMLLVTNDGRKAALDLRLIDTNMPDLPSSKINLAVENIYKIWIENEEDKLTQLVFCDLSTPRNDGFFDVYNDIRDKLISKGIPKEEIEFIHNAKTNSQRVKLFEDMRNGTKRILIGSTSKMGAGMNVQDKLIALHHLDCPWRPSDIEQREGRILRQGNQNEEVEIYRYVTEGSFDAYSYQLVQTKSTFINQIMENSNGSGRTIEDFDRDTFTYAEVKALASGNPLILDKYRIENELERLYLSRTIYNKTHVELENKYNRELPTQLHNEERYLKNLEQDILKVEDLSAENFKIVIRNQTFTSRKEASTKFYQTLSILKVGEETKIGEISNFDIVGTREGLLFTPVVYIEGTGKYKAEIENIDGIGNIVKLENILIGLQGKIDKCRWNIERIHRQMDDIKEGLNKPFMELERIKELQNEKAKIDSLLDLDKQENVLEVGKEENEKNGENEREC